MVEFSATMIQHLPEGKTNESRVYVGQSGTRTEMLQDGKARITVMNFKSGYAWLLNPTKKEYVVLHKGKPQEGPARPPLPDEPGSPCLKDNANLQCKHLGTVELNGRSADKWQFVSTQDSKTYTTTMWLDRRLGMPVRQEFPGNVSSELRGIQEGPQPDSLFTVPAGYKQIEMPKQEQPAQDR